MEPTLKYITPFTVAGIGVRTSNNDETDSSTAKLGALWNRFFSERMSERVPHRVEGSSVYGVYSDYESDVNGYYTTTAGVRVSEPVHRDDMTEVDVEGGDYLVFERRGQMPEIVFEAWGDVWRFFDEDQGFDRKYSTDFEEYRGPDEVAIHIAVRRNGDDRSQFH